MSGMAKIKMKMPAQPQKPYLSVACGWAGKFQLQFGWVDGNITLILLICAAILMDGKDLDGGFPSCKLRWKGNRI